MRELGTAVWDLEDEGAWNDVLFSKPWRCLHLVSHISQPAQRELRDPPGVFAEAARCYKLLGTRDSARGANRSVT